MNSNNYQPNPNVVLIGAGIMSATIGVILKQLQPDITITIFERLDEFAAESSDAWNNAGTGHSAFCELNYTPLKDDKTVDITKALKIASSFEVSKQFWSYLIEQNLISSSQNFISSIPHMSFVWGNENKAFLKTRFDALTVHPLFKGMQFSEDWNEIEKWIPLVMHGRDTSIKVAATKMDAGTDVNFGVLTRAMFSYLKQQDGVSVHLNHEVRDIEKDEIEGWNITVKDLEIKEKIKVRAGFVFIGAGGGSLPLLEKSNIPEAKGYGGFPISGQWLKCTNEKIIAQHSAKVYGKASVGAPPMSVPHLDTRMIDGKKALLFGPFAGFSTKFLKNGSFWDLASSIELDNVIPMLSAGLHNLPLTTYLINQVKQSPEDRLEALKEYLPEAKLIDWELVIAGQRVQVIKSDEEDGGVLEFGTEIVCSSDGSLAALLGASPGASTSVSVMLEVIAKCFKSKINSKEWQTKLQTMIPSYGKSLINEPLLCEKIRLASNKTLKLNY